MQQSEASALSHYNQILSSQPQSELFTEDKNQLFNPPQHKYIEHQKFGSAFYHDNNEEEYVIQRAFQPGNFTYLRKLPNQISRNCILDTRKERVEEQLQEQAIKRHKNTSEKQSDRANRINQIKKAKIGSLGYFEVFPYQESNYELPKKLAALERVQNDNKRKNICEMDFRPMGFDHKQKFQDPFRYVDRKDATTDYCTSNNYIYPFHLPQDVYNAYHQSQKRQKIITEELKIAGNFNPSKTTNSLNTVSKAKMGQILNEIEFYFIKYLKDKIGYFIGVNKRDHIEIMFERKYEDDHKVQMVLSGMLEHQILSKYVLRRNLHRWGIVNSMTEHLEYVVLPPWVKDPQEILKVNNKTEPPQTR